MSDNKTIAKNTIFLYVRSFLMMAINLYASRVILEALGVSDYGLYGAIGSIVMMFAIINGVLSVGTPAGFSHLSWDAMIWKNSKRHSVLPLCFMPEWH